MVATRTRSSTGGEPTPATKRPNAEVELQNAEADAPPAKRVKIIEPTAEENSEAASTNTELEEQTSNTEAEENSINTEAEENINTNGVDGSDCAAVSDTTAENADVAMPPNENIETAEEEAKVDDTPAEQTGPNADEQMPENKEEEQPTQPINETNIIAAKILDEPATIPAELTAVEE